MTETDARLKEALRESASKELASWYEKRSTAIEARKAMNRANDADSNDSRNGSVNEGGKYVQYIFLRLCVFLANGRGSRI
jgi:hypothetical protein